MNDFQKKQIEDTAQNIAITASQYNPRATRDDVAEKTGIINASVGYIIKHFSIKGLKEMCDTKIEVPGKQALLKDFLKEGPNSLQNVAQELESYLENPSREVNELKDSIFNHLTQDRFPGFARN